MREFLRWHALLHGWLLQLIYFKRKTYYEDRSEQGRFVKGGALVVSNHFHVYDYMVNMFLFCFRKLYVVMKSDVFKNRFFSWVMGIFGGIRSDRDTNGMKFIDESVAHLIKGHLVQIFPEAYTSRTGKMLEFKYGYVMIAQRADKPIIPVITDGNYGLFKRVHVIIGKPILLSDYCSSSHPNKEEIAELNNIVYNKCVELKAELHRRIALDNRKGKNQKGTSQ